MLRGMAIKYGFQVLYWTEYINLFIRTHNYMQSICACEVYTQRTRGREGDC